MQAILSHYNLDLDGLAAMAAARLLFPGAAMVNPGGFSPPVRDFLALYRDVFNLVPVRELDRDALQHIIVVDANAPARLGEGRSLLRPGLEVDLFDHHPASGWEKQCSRVVQEAVGATTTLLVEELRAREIKPSGLEATLLALGIYADTSQLTSLTTTARDAAAVAYLLEAGANLAVVAGFSQRPLAPALQELWERVEQAARTFVIEGVEITLAALTSAKPVGGLGLLADRLLAESGVEAAFVLVEAKNQVQVAARSGREGLSVREALLPIGGGGHVGAAAATIKGSPLAEVQELILRGLPTALQPVLRVGQVMSSPVKTIAPVTTMAEARRLMLRYGHSGLPVVDEGRLVGIISRRDLDKAQRHGLEMAPVKAYMRLRVITCSPTTTLGQARELMILHNLGRLPVVQHDRLVGIVSRSDLLRLWHGLEAAPSYRSLHRGSVPLACPLDGGGLLRQRLPQAQQDILQRVGQLAAERGERVYLVGGVVRDLYRARPARDLDVVVEGEVMTLARLLAEELDCRVHYHRQFSTATLLLPGDNRLDLTMARAEYYAYPAALPEVEAGSLRSDLFRRDFTVNTLALHLNPSTWGTLEDWFGGLADLELGLLRLLHSFSFVEDPTRILRAVRLEVREGFQLEKESEKLAREEGAVRALQDLAGQRLGAEVRLLLQLPRPLEALRRLAVLGVLTVLWPHLKPRPAFWDHLERVWLLCQRTLPDRPGEWWLVLLAVLLEPLGATRARAVGESYQIPGRGLEFLAVLENMPALVEGLAREGQGFPAPPQPLSWPLVLARIGRAEVREKVLFDWRKTREDPLLTGRDVLALGLKSGPRVGQLLKEARCLQDSGRVAGRREALQWLQQAVVEGRGE